MNKPMSLTIDADGNIVVAAPTDGAEVLVAKFTPTGQLLWQRAVSPGAPGDEERDSVSPLLLDGPSSLGSSRLTAGRRRGRLAAASVVAACAFTIGIAGLGVLDSTDRATAQAGAQTEAQKEAQSSPVVRSLGASVTDLALRAATIAEAPSVESDVGEPAPSVEPGPAIVAPAEAAESAQAPAPRVEIAPAAVSPSPVAPTPTPTAPALATSSADLRAETLKLLQQGELALAADRARALVVVAPSDAFSYLLLGAALQDQGLAGEARAVYYACAQHAYGGSVAECMALAGVSPPVAEPVADPAGD